jgi:hypothetical protein
MNRRRVGEDRGSKETDRCPLTSAAYSTPSPNASLKTLLMAISILPSRIPTHGNVSRYRPKNGRDTDAQTQIFAVEQSDNRQDYTIHPYFVLGAAFPPQPLSSCPGPLLQSLSIPIIPFKKVIPPSHRKTESPVLFTEKTAQ